MTTEEKIEVMRAYLEGKKIQLKTRDSLDHVRWGDINDAEPNWNWGISEYRVKPEEELQRMSNYQLAEWAAAGFGQIKNNNDITSWWRYWTTSERLPVANNVLIRPWGSDRWIEPIIDIYEEDCKKLKRVES